MGADIKLTPRQRLSSIVCAFMLAFFLLAVHNGFAANLKFGSDVDKKNIVLSPGERKVFTYSFLNPGNDPIRVAINVNGNDLKPLKVSVVPPVVMIPGINTLPMKNSLASVSQKWYLLEDGITHIPIYNAYIYVEAPDELYDYQIHDYILMVHASAATVSSSNVHSIKETVMQRHDYKLTVKLSPAFVGHIKPHDEIINLNFHKKGNTILEKEKSTFTVDEDDGSIVYVNRTEFEEKKRDMIDINRISGHLIDNDSGREKTLIDRNTIIVLILCIAALIVSTRL